MVLGRNAVPVSTYSLTHYRCNLQVVVEFATILLFGERSENGVDECGILDPLPPSGSEMLGVPGSLSHGFYFV